MYIIAKYRSLFLKSFTLSNKQLDNSYGCICSLINNGPLHLYSTMKEEESSTKDNACLNSHKEKELNEAHVSDDATLSRLDVAHDFKDDHKDIINIDVNKWKNVPSTLDLGIMRNFPLFNSKSKPITNKEIKSIGMFEDGYKKIPSVRNILKETMSTLDREILDKWEMRMVREMGKEKFEIYRQGLLSRGDIFHQCIELFFKGEGPNSEHLVGIEELWNSVIHALNAISNVKILESRIIHPELCYQGVVDCVGMYKNKMVAIEFKTSNKPKLILSATRDDPMQVAAYLGALNFDEMYDFPQLDGALLVIAYPTGLPAHAHYLDRKKSNGYWKLWQKRLIQFWKMQHSM